MFCRNCGYNNADGVRFCAKCGTTLEAAPIAPTAPAYGAPNDAPVGGAYEAPNNGAYNAPVGGAYEAPNSGAYNAPYNAPYNAAPNGTYRAPAGGSYKAPNGGADVKKILPIAAIGVVAAIVVILLFSLIFGNSAKSVAKKAMDRALDGDLYAVSKLYHKEIIKENDMDDKSFKEDCKEMKDEFKEMMKDLEDEQGKVKLSYKIKDEDEITGDDLDYIEDYYDDEYDLKVKKAKVFEIELCAEIDGEENEEELEITVVKIGGKWYLDIQSDVDIF